VVLAVMESQHLAAAAAAQAAVQQLSAVTAVMV
jgi:hypothetical protein